MSDLWDLRAHLELMEARMLRRINEGLEHVLGEVRDLRSEHAVTRSLVVALPGTVLGAIEAPLLQRIRAAEDRLTKLEGDGHEKG